MWNKGHARAVLVTTLIATTAVVIAPRAEGSPSSTGATSATSLGGRAAVERFQGQLRTIAGRYGWSADELRERLLHDPTLEIDPGGFLLYVDPEQPHMAVAPAA